MRLFRGLVLSAAVLPSGLGASPGMWMPAIFGDHMVVQAGRPVRVWGRDLPGTAVRVTLGPESAVARSGRSGAWSAELPALRRGGPYVLAVAGSARRSFSDVLVGEVWLGSGQSNMELALRASDGADKEIARAADTELRLFTVDRAAAFKASDDVSGVWRVCTPDSAADFSAVAYYFGRDLRRALRCPVGLVVASWGGTPGEDWVPRPALDAGEPYRSLAAQWDRDPGERRLWSAGRPFDLQIKDLRLVPAKGGPELRLPLAGWDHEEKPGSTGALTGSSAGLRYRGRVQGSAWATLGRALFAPGSDAPLDLRPYAGPGRGRLPARRPDSLPLDPAPYAGLAFAARGEGSWTVGLGEPSIRDSDLYASPPFTVGENWADYRVSLAELKQGGWGMPERFTPQSVNRLAFNVQVPFWPVLASTAYNGMIAPLTRFPVAGVLWYQGESNAGRADQYAGLLKALATSWRKAWGDAGLPFLVVQLPGYADAGPASDDSWARLRRSQAAAVEALAHAGLAVSLDLGASHDVHPKNKAPLGRRLALLAQAVAYGRPVEAWGPVCRSATAKGGVFEVRFDHARGLALRGAAAGFELAGSDGVYHPALAVARGGTLRLHSAGVRAPRSARYAWGNDPAAVLFNGAGLPAAPFSVSVARAAP